MKTIGLIGGASCESTIEYYKIINHRTNELLGNHHSAKIILVSVNFDEIVHAFYDDRWDIISKIMNNAAHQLKLAGANFIAICCNTLHKIAQTVANSTPLPFLHILEPTAKEIKKSNINKVALLGTQFTMNGSFHQNYLCERFNIECIIPDDNDIELINSIIFDELCHGIINDNSRASILKIINTMKEKGAQGIILACTELPLFLPFDPSLQIPIFNTTLLHANAIADYALGNPHMSKTKFYEIKLSA